MLREKAYGPTTKQLLDAVFELLGLRSRNDATKIPVLFTKVWT